MFPIGYSVAVNAKMPAAITLTPGPRLGREMRKARERLGISVTDLARRADVGRKFVYELEAGKESLRVDKVLAVAETLGLQLILTAPRTRGGTKAWIRRNGDALAAYNRHVEEHGVFSEGLRSF